MTTGDHVTVTKGQWLGWGGTVLETLSGGHLWVRLDQPGPGVWVRALRVDEVEKR